MACLQETWICIFGFLLTLLWLLLQYYIMKAFIRDVQAQETKPWEALCSLDLEKKIIFGIIFSDMYQKYVKIDVGHLTYCSYQEPYILVILVIMVFIFQQGLIGWVLLGLLWIAFVVFCTYQKCYKMCFPCWFCKVNFSYSLS